MCARILKENDFPKSPHSSHFPQQQQRQQTQKQKQKQIAGTAATAAQLVEMSADPEGLGFGV